MDLNPRFSRLRRFALSAVVPVASTIVYASQLVLTGKGSWGTALEQETIFCGTWWLVGVLVFRLCAWVHREPPSRTRVIVGLALGALVSVILQPALTVAFHVGIGWANVVFSGESFNVAAAVKGWPLLVLNLLGFSFFIYGGIVIAWHALTYYRDSQRRRFEAAEMSALLQKAQLQALRSQLNPHFLFNTLHSIAELVHENPRLAEQMLLRLSDLLREALHASGAQEIALHEEIDFAKGYLEIEQLRLGDRLSVTWDITPDALVARVPSLLLQPLIENAIQHGIASSTRPGTLVIRARRDGDSFEMQVHDSGAGLHARGSDRKNGVGLANTSDRLQRIYGERQRFELINGQGLCVRVRLPFAAMPQKGADVS